jgi:hypothetical protein
VDGIAWLVGGTCPFYPGAKRGSGGSAQPTPRLKRVLPPVPTFRLAHSALREIGTLRNLALEPAASKPRRAQGLSKRPRQILRVTVCGGLLRSSANKPGSCACWHL